MQLNTEYQSLVITEEGFYIRKEVLHALPGFAKAMEHYAIANPHLHTDPTLWGVKRLCRHLKAQGQLSSLGIERITEDEAGFWTKDGIVIFSQVERGKKLMFQTEFIPVYQIKPGNGFIARGWEVQSGKCTSDQIDFMSQLIQQLSEPA